MKIFGFFGLLSSAQEVKFDVSRRNTRLDNSINLTNLMAAVYAEYASEWEYVMSNFFNEKEWKYGCWGQINGNEIQAGIGEPLDAIDYHFRKWKRCRECINLDFSSSSTDDIWAGFWNSWIDFDYESKRFVCQDTNDAHRARCKCDDALAYGIVENLGSFHSYYEVLNGFDFEMYCRPHPKNPNIDNGTCGNDGDNQRKCCGEYPQRFPYDDKAGCIQCCDAASATYNVHRHSCCGAVLGSVGCQ